jgi:cobalt-zinc-cadmium resistance protein CzcA
MLNAIIQFSIKNKLIVGLLIMGLIIWGMVAVTKLPIDAVPDITNNQVLVITAAPSLGAPDVERFITVPVEQATRNVPGIIEQRSFSRFGLSLVTIVFDDKTDVYWARQQVGERLVQVQQQIPAGIGVPELGPVTTGLGEIFQYVVKAKKGYEDKYSLTELRSIQDWIVRRQLLGTDGVADVSSFGGLVKQYEVAISTAKLNSFKLTIGDVYKAMQDNNQNTGGAYIEKGPNILFIRSEGLVKNIEDISQIVVKQVPNGTPVLVKDVAEVKLGNAIRYGATVYNTDGEVAGAIVMMLKGGNSNLVINNIKEKIAEIEKSLPEGVIIEPFLDRTKMVNHAIGTVETNLLEGALIVVFVLVLFLGNLRAGFIVASVIPLAMLFAIIMMNMFGVSGNLMSLGALDFGLLVDGAVIIVEAVMHKLKHHAGFQSSVMLNQHQMDHEVEGSSKKMMGAAAFGQVIILIVYLPILTLQGIEGKMFKPMAQTVSFAIIGAFILSLTYIPMMSALFLSKHISHKENFSDKMIRQFQNWYRPLLLKVLEIPKLVIGASAVVFIIAMLILTTLGGEFIPKLEEGDFAVDTRILTGSSLSKTIEETQKTAKVLLDEFDEVEKIVTKIGSGEIPTDPMPVEAADMMVILKPKKEWTNAKTFDELAEKMSEALQAVPGVATGFQFPVQMRFNELMTGARQDVVCKIFGDDLDSLSAYANTLGGIINKVDGAKDLFIETVTGVPQMVITYNRPAIAKFGATISDINNTVQAAYAGAVSGLVFENDKRYDLVIRLNANEKNNIDNIGDLMVGLPNGQQVPLRMLANVELQDGPYQIQREDAQRRITVGFNVRGRDVQSIVSELTEKAGAELKLPAGYFIKYGGAYENLQHATRRLAIALPIALLLILVLLYFAFNQLKYCLLIFSAIPLSAIGGVLALWSRGMPFSISAGVGFIALFGVAVLNGIVLISEMNRLKKDGIHHLKEVIMQATQVRLRPVLMTAAVASLGFLPMAISSGAGAEVQRPLATVVIGGLISATLLTLFVLPSLYLLFERKPRRKKKTTVVATAVLLMISFSSIAQNAVEKKSLQDLWQLAAKQEASLKVTKLQQAYAAALQKTAGEIPKTQFLTEIGSYNSFNVDSRISILQSIPANGSAKKQKDVLATFLAQANAQAVLQWSEVKRMIHQLYIQLQHNVMQQTQLQQADSIYTNFQKLAQLRYSKGETNILEKITIDNAVQQNQLQLLLVQNEQQALQQQIAILLQSDIAVLPAERLQENVKLYDTALLYQHPLIQLSRQLEKQTVAETALEQIKLKPDFVFGYNNQSLTGWQTYKDRTDKYFSAGNRFSSVTAGINIPVFNKQQKAKVNAAKLKTLYVAAETDVKLIELKKQLQQVIVTNDKWTKVIQHFKDNALPQSLTIIQTANLSYKNGQIGYLEWGNLIHAAISTQLQFAAALKEQALNHVELDYLLQNN